MANQKIYRTTNPTPATLCSMVVWWRNPPAMAAGIGSDGYRTRKQHKRYKVSPPLTNNWNCRKPRSHCLERHCRKPRSSGPSPHLSETLAVAGKASQLPFAPTRLIPPWTQSYPNRVARPRQQRRRWRSCRQSLENVIVIGDPQPIGKHTSPSSISLYFLRPIFLSLHKLLTNWDNVILIWVGTLEENKWPSI